MKITLVEFYGKPIWRHCRNVWSDDIKSIEHGQRTLENAAAVLWRNEKDYLEDFWTTENIFVVVFKGVVRGYIIE